MIEYKSVRYSRKNEEWFEVQTDNKKVLVAAHMWEKFLSIHGTNPKHKMKRIAGTDSVDEQALIKFLAEN